MLWSVGLWSLAAAGCAPSIEFDRFVVSEQVKQLPDARQQEIEKVLATYFGTPASPRMFAPALDEEEEEEEESPEVEEASEETDSAGAPDEGRLPVGREEVPARALKHGMRVYLFRCATCHGPSGDGNGPAARYLNPHPRDFRAGVFKFTSTPYGSKPRRSDLLRTLHKGIKGTAMPTFRWVPREDLDALVDYVIYLSQRGEVERLLALEAEDLDDDEPLDAEIVTDVLVQVKDAWREAADERVLPLTHMPKMTEETIAAGRKAFMTRGCAKCHGEDGRGQTMWLSPRFLAEQEKLPEDQRQEINRDTWGNIAPAADLTAGMLHGGRRPIDIYRRIYSGINGTPMPAFGQALADEPDTIWHLVHFIRSIVEGHKFEEAGGGKGDAGDNGDSRDNGDAGDEGDAGERDGES